MSIVNSAANSLSKNLAKKVSAESIEQAAAAVAKLPAASSAKTEAQRLAEKLVKNNVAVVLPADGETLIAMAKVGRLFPGTNRQLSFGNVTNDVQRKGGFAAFVLTDEGKKSLANASEAANFERVIDKRLNDGARFGVEVPLSAELGLTRDIQHVLLDDSAYAGFLKTFEEAVGKGQAPATVGGKPYTEFFRSSDDFTQEFEVEALRRIVPGFSARPVDEQRAVASLASSVATKFPKAVHEDTRRRVAANLITHRAIEGGQSASQVLQGVRKFSHGTTVGDRIAKKGFKRIPFFAREAYGPGTYYGNGSIAADYAVQKSKSLTRKSQIVSGEVDAGVVTTSGATYINGKADTRRVPRKELTRPDYGDYYVTGDNKRFTIQGVTSFDPNREGGFDKLLPELIEAYNADSKWAQRYLSRVDPDQARRAYQHALTSPNADTRQAASALLAADAAQQTARRTAGEQKPASFFQKLLSWI